MALIGTKNLLAPLYNKVHLAAIVLFTIAFTVLRLSGGAVYTRPKVTKAAESVAANELASEDFSEEELNTVDDGTEAVSDEAEELEEENYRRPSSPAAARKIAQERAATKKKEAAAVEEEVEKRKGLSDIEQMLGMK